MRNEIAKFDSDGWLFSSERRQIKEDDANKGENPPKENDWHMKSSMTFRCNVRMKMAQLWVTIYIRRAWIYDRWHPNNEI